MAENPYAHVDVIRSECVDNFIRHAKSSGALSEQAKTILMNLQDNSSTVKFTLLKELHGDLTRAGVSNVQPLWFLVDQSGVSLPPPDIPQRNVIVQQRIETLAAKFANADYARMTSSFAGLHTSNQFSTAGIREFRCMNQQMLLVLNFAIVVIGSFVFGYFLSDIFGQSDASPGQRITCGFCISIVIFFADLYFLIKKVDTCEETRKLSM